MVQNFTTPNVVLDNLGTPSDHGNHYMTFGPDNMLYFNLGAPFNIGIPPAVGAHGLNFATIGKMSPNGTNVTTYATGGLLLVHEACSAELQLLMSVGAVLCTHK